MRPLPTGVLSSFHVYDTERDHGLYSLDLGPRGLDLLLDRIDLLSLDVFDTILSRRCVQPTHVFDWIERAKGMTGFGQARVAAEKAARKRYAKRGPEVSLEEIYAELKQTIALPPNAIEAELEAERLFLYANPTIKAVISRARLKQKRVIAISDVYLSSDHVGSLLSHAGIQVDRVYTSSDFREINAGKYNSKLYPLICKLEHARPEAMLHIGDNRISDIARANEAGLLSLETQKLHEIAARHDINATKTERLSHSYMGSIIHGEVTRWLGGAGNQASAFESYGYIYGGPLVLGFCSFILDRARKDSIDKLVLLERDGTIVRDALNLLNVADVTYRCMPASRRLTIFPTLSSRPASSIMSLFEGHGRQTERYFFDLLSIEPPAGYVANAVDRISGQRFIERNEAFLREQAKLERALLRQELAGELRMIAHGGKFAWVDVGWALSSISALNQIVEADIPAYCIGSSMRVKEGLPHAGYLFERDHPKKTSQIIKSGLELIELIFSDTSPSTARLQSVGAETQRVSVEKSRFEHLRDSAIFEVRTGALNFINDVADLLPGLTTEELQQHNRAIFMDLCNAPHPLQYRFLGAVPHDRLGGNGAWLSIADLWEPLRSTTQSKDAATDSVKNKVAKLLAALRRLRKRR